MVAPLRSLFITTRCISANYGFHSRGGSEVSIFETVKVADILRKNGEKSNSDGTFRGNLVLPEMAGELAYVTAA